VAPGTAPGLELALSFYAPQSRELIQKAYEACVREGMPFDLEAELITAKGRHVWVRAIGEAERHAAGTITRVQGALQDITARRQAALELEQAHTQLLAASLKADMAEFATGILHDIGNVLNSANIASFCVADSLRKSKAANLSKVVALLREHENDLGDFFTNNPKGRQVPVYLAQLAGQLTEEQAGALKELAQLQKNIEHIKEVVSRQQGLARTPGATETVNLPELVEDALRMNLSGVAQRDIEVIRDFKAVPPVRVEKHKVLQILVNLVRNAKQSCEVSGRQEKKLGLHTTRDHDHVRIAVSDNGVGIPPENLARIFSHGFTTKKDGHGFGLHSCALAAVEMGGTLTTHSDGIGRGATFTLELPINAAQDQP
jgi:signal transduction histidine kinase